MFHYLPKFKRKSDDKARLRALLAAIPGAYAGWTEDGGIFCSVGFTELLGISHCRSIEDIQDALTPSDAAALETLWRQMKTTSKTFNLTVERLSPPGFLRLQGRIAETGAEDAESPVKDYLLWADDITNQQKDRIAQDERRAHLAEEREKLQAMLDRLPIPLWQRDAQGRLLWCNRSYADLMNASSATIISEQKNLPLKQGGKTKAKVPLDVLGAKAVSTGEMQSISGHVVSGGQRTRLDIREIPLKPLPLALGMAYDRTREEELESEQKRHGLAYRELLEQLGSAIAVFDADQKLEFHNSAFAQLWDLEDTYLGTSPKLGDLMEKLRTMRRLPEQADFRKFKQSWQRFFTDLIEPHEDMLYLPDSTALRMLAVPHPMGGLMMTFENVTSHLELESSYNTLIAVQKETLDHLTEGVAVFGGDGRLKLWNPAFMKLWNLNPEDLNSEPHITRLTERMRERFDKESWAEQEKHLHTQALERKIQEGMLSTKTGNLIQYATVPMPDGGIMVTHDDITDSIQVEKALREKNAALETAEQLKMDFLANVSYQLRTPLNAIMGFNEILGAEYFGKLNPRQKEYSDNMAEAGQRLLHLIDDILDLSTIEAGYLKLEREDISTKELLGNLVDLTQAWARHENLEIIKRPLKKDIRFSGDARRIKQVMINLVRNAITFSPPGGKITLAADQTETHVRLMVQDSGPGIPKSQHKRIFEPFEHGKSNGTHIGKSKKGRGAGLGLSLVKSIVALHGGSVDLESEPGRGATFIISFPLPKTSNKAR